MVALELALRFLDRAMRLERSLPKMSSLLRLVMVHRELMKTAIRWARRVMHDGILMG